jgi:hypothetical protein
MYKFIGGFLNTLKPYDDEITGKLIVTENFLTTVTDLKKN